MQCPICKKDLEIKNKKIGENEAGEAIYNEFAICRDCKKQWNLDKQREKKKKLAKEALAEKTVEAGKAAEKPHKKRPAAEGEKTSAERPAQPKKKKKRPVSPENTEKLEPLLLLIQKYRLIRRKNVRTRLPKAKDR